ncbi:hypothetical protein [Pedosphaera parvula]|nr:hypothetical protein [Pedosphaera parvula]
MKLESANVRFSAALLKKKLKFFRSAIAILGTAAPLAGLAMARKRAKRSQRSQRGGMIGKLFAGLQLLGQFKPLLGNLLVQRRAAGHHPAREREHGNISQYL